MTPIIPDFPHAQATVRPASRRILFADDDPVSRLLTTRLLQNHGFSVLTVPDGAEAVAMAERQVFDAFLLDIRMPVMGGLEAAQLLRRRGFAGSIVGLTGSVKSVDRVDYQAAGMQACLPKPLNILAFSEFIAEQHAAPRFA